MVRGIASCSATLLGSNRGSVMSTVWPDPRSEMQALTLRAITARLLVEIDPNTLNELIKQLTSIVEAQLRTRPPN